MSLLNAESDLPKMKHCYVWLEPKFVMKTLYLAFGLLS